MPRLSAVVCLLSASLIGVLTPTPAAAQSWTPPIGIPAPAFGITQQAPAVPSPWTAEVPGFYYVDETAAGASDSRTYGHPAAPRATIPLSLPAGSVVEVHGTYSRSHVSPNVVVVSGTAGAPVFVRGSSAATRPVLSRPLHVRGSYFVIENLTWQLVTEDRAFKIISPTDHGALRHSDLQGNLGGGGISVAYNSSLGGVVTQVVIYNNTVHDNGDVSTTYDQDVHSIAVGARTSYLWIVDNVIHDSSGSGVQVYAGSKAEQANLHHVYLGRNHVFRTRQAGLFTKQATDVIFSQNRIHDVIHTSWSPSKGLGFQYAPERVWFLYNEVYNCSFGIYAGSDSGLGTGKDSYIIGNLIHGIHYVDSYNPNTAWSNAAIMLAGGLNRYVVGNTIYDVDAGILSPGTTGVMHIANNVVARVTNPQGRHVFLEMGSLALASVLRCNLLEGDVRLRWGGSSPRDPSEAGSGNRVGDPRFVDPGHGDFRPGEGSAARDAGCEDEVYGVFRDRYGLDIARDPAGTPRPSLGGWDIGAYEASG
jgi:hypothetical protein